MGIVENMSSFICPKCGEETAIFGTGGAEKESKNLEMSFLGKIPLDLKIREKIKLLKFFSTSALFKLFLQSLEGILQQNLDLQKGIVFLLFQTPVPKILRRI